MKIKVINCTNDQNFLKKVYFLNTKVGVMEQANATILKMKKAQKISRIKKSSKKN